MTDQIERRALAQQPGQPVWEKYAERKCSGRPEGGLETRILLPAKVPDTEVEGEKADHHPESSDAIVPRACGQFYSGRGVENSRTILVARTLLLRRFRQYRTDVVRVL